MTLREEIFEQKNGERILELRGGELEVALFVNGQLLVYDAADCAGSVGRFTVFLPDEQRQQTQRQIESWTAQGFQEETPLQEQMAPLLALLPEGSYRLSMEDLASNDSIHYEFMDWKYAAHYDTAWATGYYFGDVIKEHKTLITTQPDQVLDETRINFYVGEIKRGLRPVLVVLGTNNESESAFIIDGHHKSKAYARCKVPPRALLIEFERIQPVSLALARQTLQDIEYDDIARYLEEKAMEAG